MPVRRWSGADHRNLAAAARTLPGSVERTVASREPHFGERMRLDSIEVEKALRRVQSKVRTSIALQRLRLPGPPHPAQP
jgi:hypothetical protein